MTGPDATPDRLHSAQPHPPAAPRWSHADLPPASRPAVRISDQPAAPPQFLAADYPASASEDVTPEDPSPGSAEPDPAARGHEPGGRERGTVAHFSDDKGFGFITAADGTAVFVHYTDISVGEGWRTLRPGQDVTYERVQQARGSRGRNVRPL